MHAWEFDEVSAGFRVNVMQGSVFQKSQAHMYVWLPWWLSLVFQCNKDGYFFFDGLHETGFKFI
jgi:hypothetical protein